MQTAGKGSAHMSRTCDSIKQASGLLEYEARAIDLCVRLGLLGGGGAAFYSVLDAGWGVGVVQVVQVFGAALAHWLARCGAFTVFWCVSFRVSWSSSLFSTHGFVSFLRNRESPLYSGFGRYHY
jgi:hypothetical protein